MGTGPSNNPLMQQLQLLLTGYGYNFYNETNRARADDQLVRERASYHLAHAADLLTSLHMDYSSRFIPPLTREHPDPPQEAMAQLREMESVQQMLSGIESHIRGMPVPTQDRTWWRFRQEQTLLEQLWQFDLALVQASERVDDYVSQLTSDSWNSQGSTPLRHLLQQVQRIASERERFLLLPL